MIRRLLALAVLLCTVSAAVAASVLAWRARFVAPRQVRVTHRMVEVPRRHAALAGTTIALVSDTHIGPHFRTEDVQPCIDLLRRLQPDILVLGGDYVAESPRFIDPSVKTLAAMSTTARCGTWAILGNHDVANTRDRIVEALERVGIPVLVNAAAEVSTPRGSIWLVGIDDAVLGRPDLERAWAEVPPDAPVVALWHEPDLAEALVPWDPLLMLSGHTHGGQVVLPLIGSVAPPKLGRRYVHGRFDVDGMPLIVSRGVGMYRPPVRFNCPPEVVLITLVAPAEVGTA